MDDKKTLAREELIGLNVTIRECKDPSWIGQSGIILDETKNTFLIKIKDQKKK
jgi:RNase P/RNase MRP subunit p29